MEIEISVESADESRPVLDSQMPRFKKELFDYLDEENLKPKIVEKKLVSDTYGDQSKGDWTAIVFALVGAGGVAVNLIQLLNNYLMKNSAVDVVLEYKGAKIKFNSTDIQQTEQAVRTLKGLIKDLK